MEKLKIEATWPLNYKFQKIEEVINEIIDYINSQDTDIEEVNEVIEETNEIAEEMKENIDSEE